MAMLWGSNAGEGPAPCFTTLLPLVLNGQQAARSATIAGAAPGAARHVPLVAAVLVHPHSLLAGRSQPDSAPSAHSSLALPACTAGRSPCLGLI